MTDHPILFSAPMIRALLEGRKTQTRRVLKPQPEGQYQGMLTDTNEAMFGETGIVRHCDLVKIKHHPGDRLWVRETWSDVNDHGAPGIAYRANSDIHSLMDRPDFLDDNNAFNYDDPRILFGKNKAPLPFANWGNDLLSGTEGNWRTSIHMPRWASRLTLTVTDVRVQRLQDISMENAIAEGIEPYSGIDPDCFGYLNYQNNSEDGYWLGPTRSFRTLWNSINGPDAWDANPWVTATSFTVHKCNIDQMEGSA